MNADTTKKLARIQQMQAEYNDMMAARKNCKPNPPGLVVKRERNEFQKRISQYADEIIAIEKREERVLALSKIPSDCRGWVEAEVRIRFDKQKGVATNGDKITPPEDREDR